MTEGRQAVSDHLEWDLFSVGLSQDPEEKETQINEIKITPPLELKLKWLVSEETVKVDIAHLAHPPEQIMYRKINEYVFKLFDDYSNIYSRIQAQRLAESIAHDGFDREMVLLIVPDPALQGQFLVINGNHRL